MYPILHWKRSDGPTLKIRPSRSGYLKLPFVSEWHIYLVLTELKQYLTKPFFFSGDGCLCAPNTLVCPNSTRCLSRADICNGETNECGDFDEETVCIQTSGAG